MMMGILVGVYTSVGCIIAAFAGFFLPQRRVLAVVAGASAVLLASLFIGPLAAPWGSGLLAEMTGRLAIFALLPVTLAAVVGSWARRKLESEI